MGLDLNAWNAITAGLNAANDATASTSGTGAPAGSPGATSPGISIPSGQNFMPLLLVGVLILGGLAFVKFAK